MANLIFSLLAALLTQYVNPFVGTDAHGHTFPGAVAPFGMVQLSPDTRPKAGDWDGSFNERGILPKVLSESFYTKISREHPIV